MYYIWTKWNEKVKEEKIKRHFKEWKMTMLFTGACKREVYVTVPGQW